MTEEVVQALADTPLITLGRLGIALGIGVDGIEAAARRCGFEPSRGTDGVRKLSFAQAQRVCVELQTPMPRGQAARRRG